MRGGMEAGEQALDACSPGPCAPVPFSLWGKLDDLSGLGLAVRRGEEGGKEGSGADHDNLAAP